MKVANLEIFGMNSNESAPMVKSSLELLDGVLSAAVASVLTVVAYEEGTSTCDDLKAAIARFGYEAREARI